MSSDNALQKISQLANFLLLTDRISRQQSYSEAKIMFCFLTQQVQLGLIEDWKIDDSCHFRLLITPHQGHTTAQTSDQKIRQVPH